MKHLMIKCNYSTETGPDADVEYVAIPMDLKRIQEIRTARNFYYAMRNEAATQSPALTMSDVRIKVAFVEMYNYGALADADDDFFDSAKLMTPGQIRKYEGDKSTANQICSDLVVNDKCFFFDLIVVLGGNEAEGVESFPVLWSEFEQFEQAALADDLAYRIIELQRMRVYLNDAMLQLASCWNSLRAAEKIGVMLTADKAFEIETSDLEFFVGELSSPPPSRVPKASIDALLDHLGIELLS